MPDGTTTEARIIDGKAAAETLRAKVALDVATLKAAHGVVPGLAVVLVGNDPASEVYVRSKGKQAAAAGMESLDHRLPAETPEADLLALIGRLNDDPRVHGILVQLPLPAHISSAAVIAAIDPAKDVDGFHPINVGRLGTASRGDPLDFPVPGTPLGCLILLKAVRADLAGLDALVIGRSSIVGRPMARLLLREDCTVTIAHSRTRDLAGWCRSADIVVAAIGRPHFVRGDWLKPGALVIDVGINRTATPEGKSKLIGDVDYDAARRVAGAITPVPGGVGPMTVACLLANTLQAARRSVGLPSTAIA
jgi:methylenetetrahydrofolate dehydrogenase (NADP+)/methenyltetrahydrofolate cyclohydrolase